MYRLIEMRKDVWLENLVDEELEGIELSLPERADTVLVFLIKQAAKEPVGIFSVFIYGTFAVVGKAYRLIRS